MPGELHLVLDLATGLSGFTRYVGRGEILSSVSDGDDDADGDAATATATRTATFRLGG
jgi:hypothetical protein